MLITLIIRMGVIFFVSEKWMFIRGEARQQMEKFMKCWFSCFFLDKAAMLNYEKALILQAEDKENPQLLAEGFANNSKHY